MNRIKPTIAIILMLLLITAACNRQEHFIKDPHYRQQVETQFKKQEELAKNRKEELFKALEGGLSLKEKEALKFFLAHMPLNDLADYDGEFFLEHVRKAFEAKETFSWGKKVPGKLFRHFVLPYRVNNENLDNFRSVYFQELKKRVIHLSMKEAVLEVNHWCHEKVAYKPTGETRTSAPLSTIKTAFGRCGEETTFTVAALRAVGIPARQCYTPRWAHIDDNHAWVEAWVDGEWRYLGACEPMPDLDMAWFTEPARRAVLVYTKVFGQYDGPEEIITHSPQFAEINLTGSYAGTKAITVKVEDKKGKPVMDANVQFRLYNWGEFYPIAGKRTGSNGNCGLTVGLGDLLIWASKGETFGYKKISAAGTDRVTIVLDKDPGVEYTVDCDLVPPIEPKPFPGSEEFKKGTKRLKYEDQLRANYESTFIDFNGASALASKLGLETGLVWVYLQKSRGNWQEISTFLSQSAQDPELSKWALPLLGTITDKDLRDTPANILLGHLRHSFKYSGDLPETHRDYFIKYVLNPRIRNEIIVDYKPFLQQQFDADFIKKARQDVSILIQWIRGRIRIHPTANYYNVPITPRGVYRLRVSDSASRDIFFVGLCRSFGIPARLEPANKTPQYVSNNRWVNAYFENQPSGPVKEGFIGLEHVDKNSKLIPEYYIHFTLAKYFNGEYHTLDYGHNTKLTEFPEKMEVETGHYLLVTGNRLKDGTVLCRLRFFNINENQTRQIPVEIRRKEVTAHIYGTFDLDTTIRSFAEDREIRLSEMAGEKGLILGWLDPGKEPTRHAMNEIRQWREKFAEWGGGFVFFIAKDKITAAVDEEYFANLPPHHVFSVDSNNERLLAVEKATGDSLVSSLPVFIVVDKSGQIICLTRGYRIGTAELLLKCIL